MGKEVLYYVIREDGKKRGASDYIEAEEYARAWNGQVYEESGNNKDGWKSELIIDFSE